MQQLLLAHGDALLLLKCLVLAYIPPSCESGFSVPVILGTLSNLSGDEDFYV